MIRRLALTLVVCLLTSSAFAAIDGAWTASVDEKRPDRMHVQLMKSAHSNMGMTMRASDFTGLTAAQIGATVMTNVRFDLRREAGNVAFEGTFRNGKGAGQFTFAPNRGYLDSVRALGVDTSMMHRRKKREWDQDELLFAMAVHDVSTSFIKSMQAEGYRETLEKYMEMRIFDITPEYIREMRSLGFSGISADDLVATRIHDVTPQFVREMRAAGWNLSLDDLQAASIHGATPQFAAEMKKLGYGNLDFDDLVAFRIHDVDAEFIAELRTLGYDKVSAEDLVAMRIHDVTPQFIRDVKAAGYSNVPVEKLVDMKIHDITPEYLRKMRGKG